MSHEIVVEGAIPLRDVAFEHFEEFFESVIEQAQLTPEQQLNLGEQLKEGIEKRDKIGNCLTWLDGQAEMLRAKEKQLAARRQHFEKFAEAVKSSLHQQMVEWGIRKVEGNEYAFTVKQNPPKVEITNEAEIPAEFLEYVPKIKVQAIKDALKEGEDVSGAQLVQGSRLEVK